MELNLIADSVVKERIYPALAQHQARPYTQAWREFGLHFPYTIPLRLQEYCDHHEVKINIHFMRKGLPDNTFYPIGLSFFNFGIDYFTLLPTEVFTAVYERKIRVLLLLRHIVHRVLFLQFDLHFEFRPHVSLVLFAVV